ncbi:hypothetical protein OTB20_34270 [Streptomyces sp. H27-H1]|uniref:hypothetical protein n=1 Tax=unclassified Streptomyces TaxID=2593676 RepID=UPI0022713624|nr:MULTISPECIES: hypothetical protein [unclassified Streptomyces]MCY0931162.1 hypothetical protein [Streptomyces sp. H27-H1]MCY0939243.1 hypothetical protein [Streptomyces sp. H34-S4]
MTAAEPTRPDRHGAWLAVFRDPATGAEWKTYTPVVRMGTRHAARAVAERQSAAPGAGRPPAPNRPRTLHRLTYLPPLRSQERAVAWAALLEVDAVSGFRGWKPGSMYPWVERSRSWRDRLADIHSSFHDAVIGFGDDLADIMAGLEDTPSAWDLEDYRDGSGLVDWEDVHEDIHKAQMSMIRQTPYGMLWIDLG